jgi:hypothetical protein
MPAAPRNGETAQAEPRQHPVIFDNHISWRDNGPTDPGSRFEALFRFYGPEKPLFDKTWILPDINKL